MAVSDAALGVDGVARLDGGNGIEVSTLYPGGKVVGVRLTTVGAEVHIVADGYDLAAVARGVAAAASPVLSAAGYPNRVDVVVADVERAATTRRRRD